MDLDGVSRDFVGSMNKAFAIAYPELAYKVTSQKTYSFDNWPLKELGINEWDFMKKYPDIIFGKAEPIPGAIEAIKEMQKELEPLGHNIVICTHQDPSIRHYTLLWLYLNNLATSKIVFVERSERKWEHVDIMIDDSPYVLNAKPNGKYSFKINHLYNVDTKADWSLEHVRNFLPIFKKSF